MRTQRWLVTGGAGFIGSHVVEDLVRRGHRVRVFDNLFSGKREHLQAVRDRIEFVKGDIRDLKAVRRAMKGVQYVSHQAALRSVARSMEDPVSYAVVNVTGTVHVLLAAKEAGVRRVVFASSSSLYGDQRTFPQREDLMPSPVSPYAASKLSGEHFCALYSKSFGLETACLRYFNVFGPRQDPGSQYAVVIPKFITDALAGRPLEVHWDGRQSRDFTYIGDVVQANWKASQASGAAGQAFNVAGGRSRSMLDLIRVLEGLAGRRLERRRAPKRPGDVRKTWADISKARRLMGYKPSIGFEEGVRRTWDFFAQAVAA